MDNLLWAAASKDSLRRGNAVRKRSGGAKVPIAVNRR